VVLAGAQRAPVLLVFVDRMSAHAWAGSGWESLIVFGVRRSRHGRPLYAEGLTFHSCHADRRTVCSRAVRSGAGQDVAGGPSADVVDPWRAQVLMNKKVTT
jgi:hypothetical protein